MAPMLQDSLADNAETPALMNMLPVGMKSCVERVIFPPYYNPHCLVVMGFHAISSLRPRLKRDRQRASLHLSDAHVHHAGCMSLLLSRPVRSSLLNHSRPRAICPRTVQTSPSLYRGSVRARVICKLVSNTSSSQAPLMYLIPNDHQDEPRFGLLVLLLLGNH